MLIKHGVVDPLAFGCEFLSIFPIHLAFRGFWELFCVHSCLMTNSCVEANLLIMCASLPTLRLFFKTVAPGLLTSTGGRSNDKYSKSGNPSNKTRGLRTIGGSSAVSTTKPKRQHYGQVDDDLEYGMVTLTVGGARKRESEEGKTKSAIGEGSDDGDHTATEWHEDGDSERGIVQTKTTVISYSTSKASREVRASK